jgi:3-methyl-2-oxobutanoate hydroxymethyltransferase
MGRKRPTIADLRAIKGKRQLTMLRVTTMEEAEAAERAGVDIVSITPELILDPRYREVAPSLFSMPGDNFFEIGTPDDFVRWAFRLYRASADAVYCSAGIPTIKRLADDNIPVIGHVGLIPSRATWTGGFKAVGKTAETAMQVFDAVKQLEAAGAFGAEI